MSELLTLKKNKEFLRAYSKGACFVSPILVTYVRKNRLGQVRLGITTSKKVGKAVRRNRARRVIKDSYRQLFANIKPGFDIVFVARTKTSFVKSFMVRSVMKKHLKAAKVLLDF